MASTSFDNLSVKLSIPASRSRASVRGLLCLVPALLLGAASALIYGGLRFDPSAGSGRIIAFSVAAAALPCPMAALIFGYRGLRWLLLAGWPDRVGVEAEEATLTLRLGPFGTRSFDASRLDVSYPFEQGDDSDDAGFEAHLPEDEQLARFLPRISHPESPEPLNRVILRHAVGSEAEIATALRPAVDCWRSQRVGGDSPNARV